MTVNYDQVKINYFDLVQVNIDLLKGPTMCTRQGIEEKIKLSTIDPNEAENCIVETVDGQNKLYVKNNTRAQPSLQTTAPLRKYLEVLSVEDAFDVLLDAHVACNHGNAPATYEKVTKTYSVPLVCANWIVESCNVCNSNKVESENPPDTQFVEKVISFQQLVSQQFNNPSGRGLWRLNIIRDAALVSNSSRASFLLILKEDATNFVVLRPIFESCEELGLDLMKLFTEFGYPEKVCVPNMITFYKKIFHMVYSIYPAVNVPVEQVSFTSNVFEQDKEEVLTEITNWMTMMQDTYWEQSCHIVQYKLNTTEKCFTRLYSKEEFCGIPFNEFFNYRFRTRMTWITPPFLKNKPEPESLKTKMENND